MAKKSAPSAALKRSRSTALIAAAAKALALPISKIAGFKTPQAFKAQLVRSLGDHKEFDKAAHALHALHASQPGLKAPQGSAKSRAGIRPHGRVQASRFEGGRKKG